MNYIICTKCGKPSDDGGFKNGEFACHDCLDRGRKKVVIVGKCVECKSETHKESSRLCERCLQRKITESIRNG